MDEASRGTLERTGLLAQLGPSNVLPEDPHPELVCERGLHRGGELLTELRARAALA